MKKLLFSFVFLFVSYFAMAQGKFESTMKEKIAKLEASRTPEDYQALANDFSRMTSENNWLAYYYTAFSYVQKGRALFRDGKTDELDDIAASAEKFLSVAKEKSPENAENFILEKMIHSLKMMVNPTQRYMSEGVMATEALSKAESLDSDNPRIYLLKAEDMYFTPEQYGGSKEKGIELFNKALEQFNNFKPKTDLDPNWGKSEAEYFIKARP